MKTLSPEYLERLANLTEEERNFITNDAAIAAWGDRKDAVDKAAAEELAALGLKIIIPMTVKEFAAFSTKLAALNEKMPQQEVAQLMNDVERVTDEQYASLSDDLKGKCDELADASAAKLAVQGAADDAAQDAIRGPLDRADKQAAETKPAVKADAPVADKPAVKVPAVKLSVTQPLTDNDKARLRLFIDSLNADIQVYKANIARGENAFTGNGQFKLEYARMKYDNKYVPSAEIKQLFAEIFACDLDLSGALYGCLSSNVAGRDAIFARYQELVDAMTELAK